MRTKSENGHGAETPCAPTPLILKGLNGTENKGRIDDKGDRFMYCTQRIIAVCIEMYA
jgi:hypothetical protein